MSVRTIPKDLIDLKTAAEIADCTVQTIWNRAVAGKLGEYAIGPRRVRRSGLMRDLRSRIIKP